MSYQPEIDTAPGIRQLGTVVLVRRVDALDGVTNQATVSGNWTYPTATAAGYVRVALPANAAGESMVADKTSQDTLEEIALSLRRIVFALSHQTKIDLNEIE